MQLTTSLIGLFILAVSTTAAATTPNAIWSKTFGGNGHPTVNENHWPTLQKNAHGDFFSAFQESRSLNPMAVKLDAWGIPAWSISAPRSMSTPADMTVLGDGSIVLIGMELLTLYAPDGKFVWAASLPEWHWMENSTIVEIDNEIILLAASMIRIDRFSGLKLQEIDAPSDSGWFSGLRLQGIEAPSNLGWCGRKPSTKVVAATTAYVTSTCGGLSVTRILANPLRFDWTMRADSDAYSATAGIEADEHGVFVAGYRYSEANGTTGYAAKLSPTDGSIIWDTSAPDAFSQIRLDHDGHLITSSALWVDKIDRESGQTLWRHATPGPARGIVTSPAGIFVAGNNGSTATVASGYIESIDGQDGSQRWLRPITFASGDMGKVSGLAVSDDHLLVSGATCRDGLPQGTHYPSPLACELAYWSSSTSGSTPSITKPVVALPVSGGTAVAAPGDTTLAATLHPGPSGQQIAIRRINNTTGAILWEAVHPLSSGALPATSEGLFRLELAADGDVVVLYSKSARETTPGASWAEILKLDGASGTLRWKKALLDNSGAYTDVDAHDFATDTAGNVFVPVHEANILGFPDPPLNQRRILKLSASTGQQVLEIHFQPYQFPMTSFHAAPPRIASVGDDILVYEAPIPENEYGLRRLNGATGHTIWHSQESDVLIDESTGYSVSGSVESTTLTVSSINLESGNINWSTNYSNPQDTYYVVGNLQLDTEGGLIVGASGQVSSPNPPNRGLLLRIDRDKGDILWTHRMQDLPLRSINSLRPAFIYDGIVYSRQYARTSGGSVSYLLVGNALSDGASTGAQMLDMSVWYPLQRPSIDGISITGAAADGGLIVSAGQSTPGLPVRHAIEKWAPPTVYAGGSLKVNLSISTQGSGTDVRRFFVFDTVNDGSIDAPDVTAILDIPPYSLVGSVQCDISGVPCTVFTTDYYVEKLADLAPGARLRISGELEVPWWGDVDASAYSPYGFVEWDLSDNAASARVEPPIFTHGFE